MKLRLIPVAFMTLALTLLASGAALADSATHTYQMEMEVPNVSEASNGDRIHMTGHAEFTVHPNAIVDGTGTFTHTNAGGTVLGSGSWTATDLLDYQSYGCGEVLGNPFPPNLCGGKAKFRILLMPAGTSAQVPAILTVFCIVGPNPPNSHDDPTGEGITLVVPGHENFNKIVSGMNIFIKIN